ISEIREWPDPDDVSFRDEDLYDGFVPGKHRADLLHRGPRWLTNDDGFHVASLQRLAVGRRPGLTRGRPNPQVAARRLRYIAPTLTHAVVVSHASLRLQPLPAFSKEIVKFSTGAVAVPAFISTRARSSFSPA